MAFLELLGVVADIISAFSDHDTHFDVTCDTLELFELSSSWRGTARISGAGNHVRTESVSFSTRVSMPDENEHNRTKRDILRDRLRKWASESFAETGTLPKEAIVLNPSENCLSCEGFVRFKDNRWVITPTSHGATHYGAYKLYFKKGSEAVGHEDLEYLFKAPTTARVSSVDIKDGF